MWHTRCYTNVHPYSITYYRYNSYCTSKSKGCNSYADFVRTSFNLSHNAQYTSYTLLVEQEKNLSKMDAI